MLHIAKAIVMREQDVASREHDLARRKQDVADRERELSIRKGELQQLRLQFTSVASGHPEPPATPAETALTTTRHPSLARTMATIAQRVLTALEMEPRAFSPSELFDFLELPPPIETLRTTLWKMAKNGLIARPFPGVYCALQHEALVLNATSGQEAG